MARIQKSKPAASAAVAAAVTALSAPAVQASLEATPAKRQRARAADGTRLPDHAVVPSIEAALRGEKQQTAYLQNLGVAGKIVFSTKPTYSDLEGIPVVSAWREGAGTPASGQQDAVVRMYRAEDGSYVASVINGDVERAQGDHVFADDAGAGIVSALITDNGLWSGAKAGDFKVKTAAEAATV